MAFILVATGARRGVAAACRMCKEALGTFWVSTERSSSSSARSRLAMQRLFFLGMVRACRRAGAIRSGAGFCIVAPSRERGYAARGGAGVVQASSRRLRRGCCRCNWRFQHAAAVPVTSVSAGLRALSSALSAGAITSSLAERSCSRVAASYMPPRTRIGFTQAGVTHLVRRFSFLFALRQF